MNRIKLSLSGDRDINIFYIFYWVPVYISITVYVLEVPTIYMLYKVSGLAILRVAIH